MNHDHRCDSGNAAKNREPLMNIDSNSVLIKLLLWLSNIRTRIVGGQ